jgi:hypothetical protein
MVKPAKPNPATATVAATAPSTRRRSWVIVGSIVLSFPSLADPVWIATIAIPTFRQEPGATGAHSASAISGFPFSANYVANSASSPLPMLFTEWLVPVGDKHDLTGRERHRRHARERILQHAFEDVDDLFSGMAVLGSHHSGVEIDTRLDALAS